MFPLPMTNQPHVSIVGATGAVGREMLVCLEERNFPLSQLTLLASARSAGQNLTFRGEEITIKELTADSFAGIDIALFSAGGGISLEYGPIAAEAGCVVIDNSSAFRMDEGVPLVIPEINPDAARNHPRNIIANPNCSTIITLMGLAPLHKAFGLEGIIASTYQAVSGSGAQGIAELDAQIKALTNGNPIEKKVYPHQIAHNVIPHVDAFEDSGYTKEEQKMLHEGRKILDLPELKVTCNLRPCPRHEITLDLTHRDFRKRPHGQRGPRSTLKLPRTTTRRRSIPVTLPSPTRHHRERRLPRWTGSRRSGPPQRSRPLGRRRSS